MFKMFAGLRPGRGTTRFIACSDADTLSKFMADDVLTGSGDQTKINAMLTAMGAGKLLISKGTVSVTGQVVTTVANQTIEGMGNGTLFTVPNAAGAGVNINVFLLAHNNCVVTNMRFDGNKANNAAQTSMNLISATGADCAVRNCWVSNSPGTGISTACNDLEISGCNIQSNTQYGIYTSAGTRNRIINNFVSLSGQHGIVNGATSTSILDNTVVDCSQTTDATYYGINCGANDCFINGNLVRRGANANKQNYGIVVSSGSNTFVGDNDLYDSGTTAPFLDAGTNTRRLHKRQLTYGAGTLANGSAITATTETTLLDNQTFRVNSATSVVWVTIRLAVQIVPTAGAGITSSYARIDSAAGATQNGTLFKLGTGRENASISLNGVPCGGTFPIEGLSIGNHTLKVTIFSEVAGTVFCRGSTLLSQEFLEIEVTEVERS